jgi:hypothetical protein
MARACACAAAPRAPPGDLRPATLARLPQGRQGVGRADAALPAGAARRGRCRRAERVRRGHVGGWRAGGRRVR